MPNERRIQMKKRMTVAEVKRKYPDVSKATLETLATMAIENMYPDEEFVKKLIAIDRGELTTDDVREELFKSILKDDEQKGKMSARNKDAMFWMTNDDWYIIDKKNNQFVLTDKAPKEAYRSFEKYKEINNLTW